MSPSPAAGPTSYDLSLLDRALDRTVAFGYARTGVLLRRRWWPADPAPGSLRGRRVLITGASSGIGRDAARSAAALGAHVHVLSHNPSRLEAALTWLREQVPDGSFEAELCDLQSLGAVRRFADDFLARDLPLSALVHNAGVFSPDREETVDGHERTFAVHVLAPHLLTHLLTPALAREPGARVVLMSSGGMYAQPLTEDVEYVDADYSGTSAYARTKRMQVVLAELWAGRLADQGVAVHAMHPGWVDTPGVRRYLPRFRFLTLPVIRPPDQGADTLVWLLAADSLTPWTGGFWHDRALRPVHYTRRTHETPRTRAAFVAACDTSVAAHAR
jgi:dehydrogenase/reductase SDR family protein 12